MVPAGKFRYTSCSGGTVAGVGLAGAGGGPRPRGAGDPGPEGVGVAVGEGVGEAAAVAAGWAWRGAGEEAGPGLAATGPPTITTKAAQSAPSSWRWRPGRMSLTIVRISRPEGKRISSCPL